MRMLNTRTLLQHIHDAAKHRLLHHSGKIYTQLTRIYYLGWAGWWPLHRFSPPLNSNILTCEIITSTV